MTQMSRERWGRASRLLDQLLDRPADERPALLERLCAGDAGLRADLEALLAADDGAAGSLEKPVGEFAPTLLSEALGGGLRPAEAAPSLEPGTRLGPYEIVSSLGAGGMGEVYRARDTRLGREVALKVLRSDIPADAERLHRFAQEARATSALNHPHIVTVHDIGDAGSIRYISMELVQGRTLREMLSSGPVATRRLLEIAVQVADGLASAHALGIVHRDLKPENVMISAEGFAKILDFGLAKLTAPIAAVDAFSTVTRTGSREGTVMGTFTYMSPEQARGQAVDFRSDQFSFGAMLYEMAAGRRAFHRATAAETVTAILREEPEPLAQVNPTLPPPLRWIVEQCLAKEPDDRYASTRDLARHLRSLKEHLSEAAGPTGGFVAVEPGRRVVRRAAAIAAAALVGLLVGIVVTGNVARTPGQSAHRLTFRRGTIGGARFAPDGQTIVYGAAWMGDPVRLFSTRSQSPESSQLPLPDADILSISSKAVMALSLGRRPTPSVGVGEMSGTLAVAPMGGGAPRELLEDVHWADWAPDGSRLAVVHDVEGRSRLEFPLGTVLYETPGWISHPRVSPKGDLVAFIDHPSRPDDGGSVMMVGPDTAERILSTGWISLRGLAWRDDEVCFTGTRTGVEKALHAVSLSGSERRLFATPSGLILMDSWRPARLLLIREEYSAEMVALPPGETNERALSWLDDSVPRDLSEDGRTVLFDETGEGGGERYSVYVRGTDGSTPIRLGDGVAGALSPDGQWAATLSIRHPWQFELLALKTGARRSTLDGINRHAFVRWLPDGKGLVFLGDEPGRGARLYVQDVGLAAARAFTIEGISVPGAVTPDSRSVSARGPEGQHYLFPIDGGKPVPVPGVGPDEVVTRVTPDGLFAYAYKRAVPCRIYRVNLATGRRDLWKEIVPSNPTGVTWMGRVEITPDGRSYVYAYTRSLGTLYLTDGLM